MAAEEIRSLSGGVTDGKTIPLEKIVIIGEPCGKNTAPAAALVCAYLLKEAGEAPGGPPNVLVLPSDHIITDTDAFVRDVKTAAAVSLDNNIVVFGIPPRSAETGFGYMEAADGDEKDGKTAKVARFKEKPDEKTAEEYVESGKYYWNSGLYGFRPDFYLKELEQYAEDVFRAFDVDLGVLTETHGDGLRVLSDSAAAAIEAAYRDTPSLSIDYAVSEKSGSVVMVKAAFDWDDAGTWDAVANAFAQYGVSAGTNAVANAAANTPASGLAAEVSSHDNFVYSDIPVALCGVEGLRVIIQNGRALVMKKGFSNEVKKIVEKGV
jgi:mannose-1-phosphate guanylyltransferase